MKFLLIFCALIPHVYVIIFIRPFTAHKSIFHISSHARGDVIFVNCVLTLAIPFLFSCNCARPVNLGWWEQRHWGGGRGAVCGRGCLGGAHAPPDTCCGFDDEISFLQLISFKWMVLINNENKTANHSTLCRSVLWTHSLSCDAKSFRKSLLKPKVWRF